jgi:hypothetical protein
MLNQQVLKYFTIDYFPIFLIMLLLLGCIIPSSLAEIWYSQIQSNPHPIILFQEFGLCNGMSALVIILYLMHFSNDNYFYKETKDMHIINWLCFSA